MLMTTVFDHEVPQSVIDRELAKDNISSRHFRNVD